MNSRYFHWITVVLALAALIVSGICWMAIQKGAQAEQTSDDIFRNYELREKVKDIYSSMKSAEASERGFLITGNEEYLEPYHVDIERTMQDLSAVRQFVDSGELSAVSLEQLNRIIEERHRELEETISLRRTIPGEDGFSTARDVIETERGRMLMNQLQSAVSSLLSEIDERLERLHLEASELESRHAVLISFGLLVSIGTFIAAAVITNLERGHRAHAVEAMLTQQARLTAIVDSALDAVISVDGDGRVVMMNPIAENVFQRTESEMLGQPLEMLIPHRFRKAHGQHLQRFATDLVIRKRVMDGGLIFGLRADGTEFPAEASVSRTMVKDRPQFTVILKDVSERETGRIRLREQNAILARIRDAVHVRDLDGRVIFWNEGAEKLFGWSSREAMGRHAYLLLKSADDAADGTIREHVLKFGAWHGERRVTTRDQRELVIESRRSLIVDDNQRPVSQLVIDIDVTEERRRQLSERRSQRLESIGTLASGIAHDLNNVLTPITMGAKVLKRPLSESMRQEIIQSITSSAERGAGMIRQLLAFAGGNIGPREAVNVSELLEEARAILVHTLPKTITVSVELNSVLWTVCGDATELSQVLMNLAINARDAMPNGGRLVFEAGNCRIGPGHDGHSDPGDGLPPGCYVQISVIDSGCGIPPELIDKVFDPFFTTKEQGKGTGLGLATCMGIVTSHGGTMSVSSTLNRGTRFNVLLPAEEQLSAEPAATAKQDPPDASGELILVVDDEESILRMSQLTLESYGYRVVALSGGQEAVSFCESCTEKIHAIIVDMMMPEMDGAATIAALNRILPDVPIVASSGLRRPEQGGSSIHGTHAFLPKPYTDEQLVSTLQKVLQQAAQSLRV